MYDIKNLNIWRNENPELDLSKCGRAVIVGPDGAAEFVIFQPFVSTDIADLGLEVRASNCLRRAGCRDVGDIFRVAGEDGDGIMKLRGLGKSTLSEIIQRLREKQNEILSSRPAVAEKTITVVTKPARDKMDMLIEEIPLSNYARTRLEACGIVRVKDLYATNPRREPGWYAVRELFRKI